MFYYLCGTLNMASVNSAVVDCGGVGYLLTVSGKTVAMLHSKVGSTVKLFTHMSVREDAVELFGGKQSVNVLADILDTIPYELICSVSKRVPRLYIKNGEVVERSLRLLL